MPFVATPGMRSFTRPALTSQHWLTLTVPPVDGVPRTKVEFDAGDAVAIAVTVEPAGGSEQPTSDPVYTARL